MNALWLVWVVAFVVLETLGLLRVGGLQPLTYWITRVLSPFGEFAWALLIGAAGWFVAHVVTRLRKER